MGGLTALSSILPAGQLAGKLGTLTKGAGAFFGGNKLYAAVSVVSSATDSVVNGYIMTSDFAASFDELESITDPKQKEEAKRKLLFMALLNGALTYHALKGDIGDLKALKAQGHLIPDDILLQKKLKPRDALPSQLGDANVLNETSIAKTALSTGMADPQTAAAKQNVLTPGKLQNVHYDPAKGYEGWHKSKHETVNLHTETDAQGNVVYKKSDSTGSKELSKEEYNKQLALAKKEKQRADAISLADIEGRILDEAGQIDSKKLKAYFEQLKQEGVQIMTGKNANALLNKHNANALYIPGDKPGQPGMLVLRENASRHHIIEELMHLKQHQAEGFRTLTGSEIIDMELEAHGYMLEYAHTHGWTETEIAELKRNKKSWEGDKQRYNDPAEFEFRAAFNKKNRVFKSKNDDIVHHDTLRHWETDGVEYIEVYVGAEYEYVQLKRTPGGEWNLEKRINPRSSVTTEKIIDALPDHYKAPKAPEIKPHIDDTVKPPASEVNPNTTPAEQILAKKLDWIKAQPSDMLGGMSYEEVVLQMNKLDTEALNVLAEMKGLSGEKIIRLAAYLKETQSADTMSLFLKSKKYSSENISDLISDVKWYNNLVRTRNAALYNPNQPLPKPDNMNIAKEDGDGFKNGLKQEGNKKTISYDVLNDEKKGNFTRSYENGKLSIEGSSLDMTGKGDIPEFVKNSPQLIADGKGTPTIVWITLMQMQQLGIKPGSLNMISLSNVMNIESVFQYSWLKKKNAVNPHELMQTSKQYIYAETIAIQSGHQVNNVSVSDNGIKPRSIEEFIIAYKKLYPGKNLEKDINFLRNKYGVEELYWGFDINLHLAPQ